MSQRLYIKIMNGNLAGRKFSLEEPGDYLVGRVPNCDICLPDTSVSGHHGTLSYDGVAWRVQDLRSTNGTELNGSRVQATAEPLPPEGMLRFANVQIQFRLDPPFVADLSRGPAKPPAARPPTPPRSPVSTTGPALMPAPAGARPAPNAPAARGGTLADVAVPASVKAILNANPLPSSKSDYQPPPQMANLFDAFPPLDADEDDESIELAPHEPSSAAAPWAPPAGGLPRDATPPPFGSAPLGTGFAAPAGGGPVELASNPSVPVIPGFPEMNFDTGFDSVSDPGPRTPAGGTSGFPELQEATSGPEAWMPESEEPRVGGMTELTSGQFQPELPLGGFDLAPSRDLERTSAEASPLPASSGASWDSSGERTQLQQEIEGLRRELELARQSDPGADSSEVQTLRQQVEQLGQQVLALTGERDTLRAQHQAVGQARETLAQQHEALQKQHEQLSQQQEALQQQLQQQTQTLTQLQQQSQSLQVQGLQGQQLQQQNQQLGQQLQQTQQALKQLQANYQQGQQGFVQLQQAYQKLQGDSQASLQHLQGEARAAQQELSTRTQELAARTQEAAGLRERVRVLEGQLGEVQAGSRAPADGGGLTAHTLFQQSIAFSDEFGQTLESLSGALAAGTDPQRMRALVREASIKLGDLRSLLEEGKRVASGRSRG